jgi:DNA polymerase V
MSKGFNEHETEGRLDLNQVLIKRPHSTYYLRVTGDSMTGVGIFPDDLLVVERTDKAKHGDIVIARVMDDLCVKRYEVHNGEAWLVSENPEYLPFKTSEHGPLTIWGKVRYSIHAQTPEDAEESEEEDEWPDVIAA